MCYSPNSASLFLLIITFSCVSFIRPCIENNIKIPNILFKLEDGNKIGK